MLTNLSPTRRAVSRNRQKGGVGAAAKQNPSLKSMEPAQIINYIDLLLIEILQTWTYDCEVARNSDPDTPERKNS